MRFKNISTYFPTIILTFAVVVFVFGSFAEGQTKRLKNKKTGQITEQADDKIKYAPDADLLKEMQAQITIVESKKNWAQLNRQRPIVNQSGILSTYIAQFKIEPDGEALIDVIVIRNSKADKFYEIRGFDFPRPFDDLKWTSEDTLQFDQWVNPRKGGRYRVNVQIGKLVAAGYLTSD